MLAVGITGDDFVQVRNLSQQIVQPGFQHPPLAEIDGVPQQAAGSFFLLNQKSAHRGRTTIVYDDNRGKAGGDKNPYAQFFEVTVGRTPL